MKGNQSKNFGKDKKRGRRKQSENVPSLGHYLSRKEWERACWRKIAGSQELLKSLTTSYERHNLVMRAAVLDWLAVGKTYRQIAKELWLSPQTISAIKKAITENNYRSYSERSKKERKKRIYSTDSVSFGKMKPRAHGLPRRTKYGTIYI